MTNDIEARATSDVDRRMSESEYREIQSFEDALKALNDAGIGIVDASEELGDGFTLLSDEAKGQLVGVGFLIMDGNEIPGDYGKSFVSIRVVTQSNLKFIINDGSTGIRDQVVDLLARHGTVKGLFVPSGLRVSTYLYCSQCQAKGKSGVSACPNCGHSPMSPAHTYYLDTAKRA